MRPAPYIGISGIMSRDEIGAILKEHVDERRRLFAFGVLISAKTIHGIPNRYPHRYPRPDQLRGIFERWNVCDLLTLHYSADDDRRLSEDIGHAIFDICRVPDGLQLNIKNPYGERLPDPNKVAAIASVYPRMRIILQIVPTMFSSRAELWRYVREYAFSATDVLIDGSRGNGVDYFADPLNVASVRADLLELRSSFPHLGLGIAGGLCAETLSHVAGLLREIPDLSLDMEGKIRDANDRLMISAAVEAATLANRIVAS